MTAQHITVALIIVAILIAVGGRFAGLPGDICYQGKQFTLRFPIVTCLVISLILSILLSIFGGGQK